MITSKAKVLGEITTMPYGKILVVDDVEINLLIAKGLLQYYEIKVETAISGFIAIAKVQEGSVYDIIFMDHMMPYMDGKETVSKLRKMGYVGTIIALTANKFTGNMEELKEDGFDDFLPKPIEVWELNTLLNKYVHDRYIENKSL